MSPAKSEEEEENMFLKDLFGGGKSKGQILAPVSGTCVPMSQVQDPTFSQEILGRGVAIIPSEGRIVAPGDGEVTMVFENRHAISITTGGAELIIHIGLDTVNLQGQYFESFVKSGDKVKAGELMIEFDLEKIKEAGYDVITPVIVCNTPEFPDMVCHTGMDVHAGDPVIDL